MRHPYAAGIALLFLSYSVSAGEIKSSIKIGFFENESSVMDEVKISMIQAIEAAQKSIEGQVVKAELEEEDGYLVYEIKILGKQGKQYKLTLDPVTGNILQQKLAD